MKALGGIKDPAGDEDGDQDEDEDEDRSKSGFEVG